MGVKRWNGSAYTDLNIPKVNNVTPDNALMWNGTRYVLLWPAPIDIFDDFNRTSTTGNIGVLWNKIGVGSEVAANSFDVRTTDGAYGIQSISSLSGDNGYVEAVSGGASNPRSDRYTFITGRVADDGLSGLYCRLSTADTQIGSWSGTMDRANDYAGWMASLTSVASGGGVADGETVRMTYIGDVITVTKGATTLISGTTYSYRKGKTYRRGGAVVTRTAFLNGGALDSLRIRDIDYV